MASSSMSTWRSRLSARCGLTKVLTRAPRMTGVPVVRKQDGPLAGGKVHTFSGDAPNS